MCDYSLQNVKSRPAKVGDKLTTGNAAVRGTFEESIQKFGVEGETAHKWLDGTMDMLRALVSEIEAGGGAGGGRA